MTEPIAPARPIPTPPDFPVEWPDPADAALFWTQDRMHWPDPVGWLTESFERRSFNQGVERAAAEVELPIQLRYRTVNRYLYMCASPRSHDPAVMAELGRRTEAALRPRMLDLQRTWDEEVLPELKSDVAALRDFGYARATDGELEAHLDWLVERRVRHWHLHFVIALPMLPAMGLFAHVYRELLRPADETEPFELLQGFPNKTVEAGHALWELSREATRSPEVLAALEGPSSARGPAAVFAELEQSPAGIAFAARLRAYLDVYGWRGDSWSMDDRTWREHPQTPLANLRAYVGQPDAASPVTAHAALAERREAAIARARDRLAGAPAEARGQLEALLRAAQTATVLQEDHNYYIDQMLQHLARRAFVAAGSRLAARGWLGDAEDVLYLTADELRASLREPANRSARGDLRELVEDRRWELTRWRSVTPPPALGTPPPPPSGEPSPLERALAGFFGAPPPAARSAREVRGNAGSRGRATGRARVALTLAAASALEPGEILVCPTTAPPWTPLFATAAAVVTDTGGILSHCAVVAREFGIPAVVGTRVGTATIRTGQRITVDGSAGVVTIEG